jgi:hypothetical protein
MTYNNYQNIINYSNNSSINNNGVCLSPVVGTIVNNGMLLFRRIFEIFLIIFILKI